MRAANKTIFLEPNYSQTNNQFQPFIHELNQPHLLNRSRAHT